MEPTDAQRCDAFALQETLQWLSDRDYDFACSLLGQLHRRGSLSDKQWRWVTTLAERGMRAAPMAIVEYVCNYVRNGNL